MEFGPGLAFPAPARGRDLRRAEPDGRELPSLARKLLQRDATRAGLLWPGALPLLAPQPSGNFVPTLPFHPVSGFVMKNRETATRHDRIAHRSGPARGTAASLDL